MGGAFVIEPIETEKRVAIELMEQGVDVELSDQKEAYGKACPDAEGEAHTADGFPCSPGLTLGQAVPAEEQQQAQQAQSQQQPDAVRRRRCCLRRMLRRLLCCFGGGSR